MTVIPSAEIGSWRYAIDPRPAFGTATVVGWPGTDSFLPRGREFEAYA